MHPSKKSLMIIALTSMLTGTVLAATADTGSGKSFDGVVVKDAVVVGQFPKEVQSGSVAVSGMTELALASAARIGSEQAAAIAAKAIPGKVVGTRLGEENGYLIWDVSVLGGKDKLSQLKLDAGNGRLLAIEPGGRECREGDEEAHHSGWKFWEDDDHGEREHHSSWKFWEHGEHDGHDEKC